MRPSATSGRTSLAAAAAAAAAASDDDDDDDIAVAAWHLLRSHFVLVFLCRFVIVTICDCVSRYYLAPKIDDSA